LNQSYQIDHFPSYKYSLSVSVILKIVSLSWGPALQTLLHLNSLSRKKKYYFLVTLNTLISSISKYVQYIVLIYVLFNIKIFLFLMIKVINHSLRMKNFLKDITKGCSIDLWFVIIIQCKRFYLFFYQGDFFIFLLKIKIPVYLNWRP